MATTVTFAPANAMIKNPQTGAIRVNFSDGTELNWDDASALTSELSEALSAVELVRLIAIANRVANDEFLDSPALWDGKSFTFDPEKDVAGQMCKVI